MENEKKISPQLRYYYKNKEVILEKSKGRKINYDKDYHSKYYEENKDAIREKAKMYYQKNKDRIIEHVKKRMRSDLPAIEKRKMSDRIKQGRKNGYVINENDYKNLLEKQDYKCAICETTQSNSSRSLGIDHNHLTGDIRGLLCNKCNLGIGYFNDNVESLKKAIIYLDNNK